MVDICFYFQVHQPLRMRQYQVFDIGKKDDYFDKEKNKEVLQKVARKCYLPMNQLLLRMLEAEPGFKISFSFSGILLEQLEKYSPKTLELFQKLADTGRVEILNETYYHSLSFLFSKEEFREQIKEHQEKIRKLFGNKHKSKVFRNTELIYNNELAYHLEWLGYKGVLLEGADHILDWRSPNFIYQPKMGKKIKLLLKNYKLSDDIAFRFSNKSWKEHPLTVEKFAQWVNAVNGNGECVNLFMDYETFGEHQWADTGIFKFMKRLPEELLKHPDNNFKTPTDLVKKYHPKAELDVHYPVSWADIERDVSAWLGNKLQQAATKEIYALERPIKESGDLKLLKKWKRLTTSDHYYYMCTKWFSDGDVHKYFNPYDSPYDAFMNMMNIINDLKIRLKTSVKEKNQKNLNTQSIVKT